MIRKLCEKISDFYQKKNRARVIVSEEYMLRHYILFKGQEFEPGNNEKVEHNFNVFLHNIRGSDEPVYHDHPWPYLTLILSGGYWEHTPIFDVEGYIIADTKKWYGAGSFRRAKSGHYHWLEMGPESTWTLFMRGKRCNEWGFMPMMHKDKINWKDWVYQREALGFTR